MKPAPSLSAIAREAGVAKSTASLALRNDPRVAKDQRERIQKLAAKMGYQTNALLAKLMFEMRKTRQQKHVATMAAINAYPEAQFPKTNSHVRNLLRGAEEHAEQLGYSLDHFWLHDPELRPARLAQILRARNIQGVLFYGIRSETDFQNYSGIWQRFPCVTVGAHLKKPALHFVSIDHHSSSMRACEHLRAAGYRRTGLVMSRWLDAIMEHRLAAGYQTSFQAGEERFPILLLEPRDWKNGPGEDQKPRFAEWIRKHRLDSCIGLNDFLPDWVRSLGIRVPEEMGVALLDLPRELRGIAAGMESQQEWFGIIAIDVLIGQIHRGERGIPPFQRGTLTESLWRPGPTVRPPLASSAKS